MLKALRGTKDILPEDVTIWQHIESSARDIFAKYNYEEIRTPIIEDSSLFIRSIGDTSDIVQKEMYVFSDRGGRTICLRPEATASIVRAYLESPLRQTRSVTKLFYIGPMFRGERPQKGRQRQFHQLGIEAIGSDNPFLDVEIMVLAAKFLEKLGIKGFRLKINSIGCHKDKRAIMERNRILVKPYLDSLCSECRERHRKNVLRIFDCKRTSCKEVLKNIRPESSICTDCTGHFESVKEGLKKLGIDYTIDSKIVRGLDYYTKTVFEIVQEDLGAKDSICAGGRYNDLIQKMGGRHTPAVGFAFGIERLILAMKGYNSRPALLLDVFVATTGEALYKDAFMLMDSLRERGLSCDIDYERKSLKAQMRIAEQLRAQFVVIFGEEEFRNNKVILRDMKKRNQRDVWLNDIIEEVITELHRV